MWIKDYTKTIVNCPKLHDELKTIYGARFDSVNKKSSEPTKIFLYFTEQPTEQEQVDITNLVINFVDFTVAEQMEIYLKNDVSAFCNEIIFDFTAQNIAMGITQAGKTKVVADALRDLNYYIRCYSLYEAMAEIDRMIAAGIDPNLSPFVTETRMNDFKNVILGFLT